MHPADTYPDLFPEERTPTEQLDGDHRQPPAGSTPVVEQDGKRPGPVEWGDRRTEVASRADQVVWQQQDQYRVPDNDGATVAVMRRIPGDLTGATSDGLSPAFTPEPGSVYPSIQPEGNG